MTPSTKKTQKTKIDDVSPAPGLASMDEISDVVARFRRVAEAHPVLPVNDERNLLSQFVAAQIRMAEIMATLVSPIECAIGRLDFEEQEDGPTESRRRTVITRDLAQKMLEAAARARAAQSHTKPDVDLVRLIMMVDYGKMLWLGSFINESLTNAACGAARAKEIALEYRKIDRGNERVRETLYKHNCRLVLLEAFKYRQSGQSIEDLIQEGSLGLLSAIDKYVEGAGENGINTKLSTVAVPWIQHKIQRYFANRSRDIRIPVYVQEKLQKLRKASQSLAAERGEEIDLSNMDKMTDAQLQELGDRAGFSMKVMRSLRDLPSAISLNAPLKPDGEGEAGEVGDMLAERPTEGAAPESDIDYKHQSQIVNQVMKNLEPGERLIAALRFDLAGKQKAANDIASEQVERFMGKTKVLLRQVSRTLPTPAEVQILRRY